MAINNNFIVPFSFGSAYDALTCLVFCGSRLVFCLSIVYGVIAQQIHRFCMENYDLKMLITFILRWKLEDISNRMTHNHRHGTTVWNGRLFFYGSRDDNEHKPVNVLWNILTCMRNKIWSNNLSIKSFSFFKSFWKKRKSKREAKRGKKLFERKNPSNWVSMWISGLAELQSIF